MDEKYFLLTKPLKNNFLIQQFSVLAQELHVVLLVNYFEKSEEDYFKVEIVVLKFMLRFLVPNVPVGNAYNNKSKQKKLLYEFPSWSLGTRKER
jgi:hypothetical protein